MKDEMQFLADLKYVEDIKNLSRDLADHLSVTTTKQIIPDGTRRWLVNIVETLDPFPTTFTKIITIDLINFFGVLVGYSPEIDLLVLSKLKKEN